MRVLAALLPLLLVGCLLPGRRSEPVVFHAFSVPPAVATKPRPTVHVPRAVLPAGLRRPSLVIESREAVRVEDSHRWLGPLESTLPEAIGRRLTALTGLPCTSQPPPEDHLVLLIEVLRMDVVDARARMRLRLRIELSDGKRGAEGEYEWHSPLAGPSAGEFVAAQSANLDQAAASLVPFLTSQ